MLTKYHLPIYLIDIQFGSDNEIKGQYQMDCCVGSWRQTHKCWCMFYNKENHNLILRNFDQVEIERNKNN